MSIWHHIFLGKLPYTSFDMSTILVLCLIYTGTFWEI